MTSDSLRNHPLITGTLLLTLAGILSRVIGFFFRIFLSQTIGAEGIFIDLAVCGESQPVPLASIAQRQEISVSYLEQLMAKLKKAGLVKSVRGVNGGYCMAKPASEVSVGDVLRALEGELIPVECAGIDNSGSAHCNGSSQCVSKIVWAVK